MRKFSKYFIIFFIIAAFLPQVSLAAPVISGTNGEFTDEAAANVLGSGFGSKTNVTPLVFDNFDSGMNGDQIKGENASHYGVWSNSSADTIPVYTSGNQRAGSILSSLNNIICNDTSANHAPMYIAFADSHQPIILASFWMYYNWANISGIGNIKIWRINNGQEGDKYTSLQCGQSNGQPTVNGSCIIFLDNGNGAMWPSEADGPTTLNFNFNQGVWQHYVVMLKASTDNIRNGSAIIIQDGNFLENTNSMETWDSSDSWQQATFGWYCANYASGDITLQFDDIYIDNSWQSVWFGDAANWNNVTHREIQIPSVWSDGSITFILNQGSFANGSNVYLFVIDENGNPSEGYPITLGGLAPAPDTTPPSAPTGLIVN